VKLIQLRKTKVQYGLPRKEVTYLPVINSRLFLNVISSYRSIHVTVDQCHVFDCTLSQAKIF